MIRPLTAWPAQALEPLIAESELDGFRFLRRLERDWLSGVNQFAKKGEVFFVAHQSGRLIAVGGINRETETSGRLRRFYVAKDARRLGVGRLLLTHLLGFAKSYYELVCLNTDTQAGSQFYQAAGFAPHLTANTTHRIVLTG